MYHLAIDPELQERIRADRSLIPEFMEEVLRRYAVVMLPRIVAHDAEFGGVAAQGGRAGRADAASRQYGPEGLSLIRCASTSTARTRRI